MDRIEDGSHLRTTNPAYKRLYRIGALAALVAALIFRRNLDAEWMLLRTFGLIQSSPSVPTETITDYFKLFQSNQLLGLLLLNFFDLVNYVLVGLMFLALTTALRKTSRPWIMLAAALGFAGITFYIPSNQALRMLSLSKQYLISNAGAEQAVILAAGEAAMAIHKNGSFSGAGINLSFLLVSAAGLIFSVIMLRSSIFSKGTAYLGILANTFGLCYYIVLAAAPALVYIPLSISAVFLLLWYLRIGLRLWALSSLKKDKFSRFTVPDRNRVSHLDPSQPA